MKRTCVLLAIAFALLFVLPSFKIVAKADSEVNANFVLPASLQIIEDEAFAGTAIETVIIPEGLLSIGERAFDGVYSLRDIYIPDTTTEIADTAFIGAPSLTIHGIGDSYANDWATEHEIPFVVDDIWNRAIITAVSQRLQIEPIIRLLATLVLLMLLTGLGSMLYETRCKRPQDRPEFYPIDYCFP